MFVRFQWLLQVSKWGARFAPHEGVNMRLPIDTSAMRFAGAGPAEPVLDFETRQPKTDEHAVPSFNFPVITPGTGKCST